MASTCSIPPRRCRWRATSSCRPWTVPARSCGRASSAGAFPSGSRMFELRVDGEVTLALLEEQHAPELFRLLDANRAYLRQWLPWLDANTRPEHTAAFIQASLRQFAARDGLACGIRLRGTLAGVAGLHRIDWANRRTSVGYWIAETQQG